MSAGNFSQHHSFDIHLGARYGVLQALIIHHLQHWIRKNRFMGRNIIDGKCWMYQTRKDMAANFPYLSVDQTRRLLEDLVEKGVITTGNFNKSPIDKTLWYAFVDEEAFGVDEDSVLALYDNHNSNNLYERQSRRTNGKSATSNGKSATPIPNTKTNTNKETLSNERVKKVAEKSAPPGEKSPYSSRSKDPDKIKRAEHVETTDEEHKRLVEEFGEGMTKRFYSRLSEWKIEAKQTNRKGDDNRKIRKWVIAAVIRDDKNEKVVKDYLAKNKIDTSKKGKGFV